MGESERLLVTAPPNGTRGPAPGIRVARTAAVDFSPHHAGCSYCWIQRYGPRRVNGSQNALQGHLERFRTRRSNVENHTPCSTTIASLWQA